MNLYEKCGGKAVFISDIEYYDADYFEDGIQYDFPEAKVFLCITNGYQYDTESWLESMGWVPIQQGDKDQHYDQREKESAYIKLWAFNASKLGGEDREEKIKLSLELYRGKKGYEFLDWPKEKVNEVFKLRTETYFWDGVETPEKTTYSHYWPYINPSWNCKIHPSEMSKLTKEHLTKVFGFVVPSINPFNGRRIHHFTDALNFMQRYKRFVNNVE